MLNVKWCMLNYGLIDKRIIKNSSGTLFRIGYKMTLL